MQRNLLTGLLSLILTTSLSAQRIETSDSILDVFYRGESEFVGSVSMGVYGNVFDGASPDSPIFIEFKFEKGEILARTLVEMNGENPLLQQPIYLALQLASQDENLVLQAPGDAISIVRWVKGESSFWLRVQSDSGGWVSENGEARAPGEQDPVLFFLGNSARFIAEGMSTVSNQHKNLPFNTRNPDQALDDSPENAVSSQICLDLSGSEIAKSGEGSIIEYFASAYGAEAQQSPGTFFPVSPISLDIRGNFRIGVGKDKSCAISPVSTPQRACVQDPVSSGLYTLENVLTLGVECQTGGGFVEGFLTEGATLRLTTQGALYGFGEGGAWFSGDAPGVVQLSDPFETEFGNLYRQLDLQWNGPFQRLDDVLLQVGVQLQISQTAPPTDLALNWSLILVNHGSERDEPPYSGFDQSINCGASPFIAGNGLWHVGTWGCGLANERIFPHVTRSNGGFSTGVLAANTSPEPTVCAISIYDATGNPVESLSSSLNGYETVLFDGSYFQLPEGGYLSVIGPDHVSVTAIYQAIGDQNGPAHVGPSGATSLAWRLYPGNEAITWDGVALVNAGNTTADVTVYLKDPSGDTLETVSLESPVSGEKLLVLLTGLFSQSTQSAYYEIRSTAPLALMALRGAWSGAFLWENDAIPVP